MSRARCHESLLRNAILAVLVAAAGPAAAGSPSEPGPVPPSPARPADLPPPPPPPARAPIAVPAGFQRGNPLTLAQVLDVALRVNPETRAAWQHAISAAQEVGVQRAAYYPDLELEADASRVQSTAQGGRFSTLENVYGASINLNYLLIDFGGRRGDLDEARNLLLAADWTHSAAIQNLILRVEVAYYSYLESKAGLEASAATVQELRTALEAAETRHDAGVATIADVLQARTVLSRAELNYLTIEGGMQALRGALATAVGVPPDTPFEVGNLPEIGAPEQLDEEVSQLVATSAAKRPDLAAARLRTAAAESHVKSVRSEGLPTLSLGAGAGRAWFDPWSVEPYGDAWSVALLFRYPLFTGFENTYKLRQAESDARIAADLAEALEQQALLDTWTSYYDLKTATKKIATSRDLLASAEENEKVALGRYKEGVGSVLDLLTAQSLLASARADEIKARADWLIAVARLARDTGTLTVQAAGEVVPSAAGKETDAQH